MAEQVRTIEDLFTEQEELLVRLRAFVATVEFQRLLGTWQLGVDDPSGYHLAAWLLQPVPALAARPIDVALEPGGIDRVHRTILRAINGTCA